MSLHIHCIVCCRSSKYKADQFFSFTPLIEINYIIRPYSVAKKFPSFQDIKLSSTAEKGIEISPERKPAWRITYTAEGRKTRHDLLHRAWTGGGPVYITC